MRRLSLLGAAIAAVLTISVVSVLPAEAADAPQRISRCGQAITSSSVYFDRDLTCAGGFRVPLLFDDEDTPRAITVDLRGHRLRGPGSGDAFNSYNSDVSFTQVSLKNGRVDHWGTGFFAAITGLTVTKVHFTNNLVGVYCGGGNCQARDSVFKDNEIGTTMNDAGFGFTHNLFVGNDIGSRSSGPGVTGTTYLNNAFTNNVVGVSIAGYGGAQLTRNVFTGNEVGVRGGPDYEHGRRGFSASLDHNLFVANGDGVNLRLDPNEDETASLAGNVAIRNTGYGFYAPGATDLGGNRAVGNGKPCVGITCSGP
jgi:Periplasmic copper-binding protein (NosD)